MTQYQPPLQNIRKARNICNLHYVVTGFEFFALFFTHILLVQYARPFRQHAEYYTATGIVIGAVLFSFYYTFLMAYKIFPKDKANTIRMVHIILLGLYALPLFKLADFYFHYTHGGWLFPNWPP